MPMVDLPKSWFSKRYPAGLREPQHLALEWSRYSAVKNAGINTAAGDLTYVFAKVKIKMTRSFLRRRGSDLDAAPIRRHTCIGGMFLLSLTAYVLISYGHL
ncbi:hypothetical protein OH76DRAFT_1412658 [Lentinus brumalis]|uniref:Uncharacterized protein n=1 Tax=Lentinus brumalis TaxID=2498619 RepID=A0A371CKM5_9APHY|nr:hypothetical protein OH76DRAFT_1412658 [Polyporus brumalis]